MTDLPHSLVERDNLLAEIDRLLDGLAADNTDGIPAAGTSFVGSSLIPVGNSSIIVLEGGIGHGKTALLNAVYQMSLERQGLRVRYASCSLDEVEVPFGVVQQLTGAVTAGTGYESLASATPLVVLIDDLEWCDEPSLRVLSQLARRLHHLPVVLVVTYPAGDPGLRNGQLVDLTHSPSADIWPLDPLSHDGVRTLCQASFPDASDEFVQTCQELTDGIPLLLSRLLYALRHLPGSALPEVETVGECLPPGLASVLLTHARRRGQHLEQALRRLAVLRSPVRLDQAAHVLGTDLVTAADTVAELARLGLATADGSVEIVPPMVRNVVRDELKPSERHDVGARAATALAADEITVPQAALYLVDTYPTGSADNVDILVDAARKVGRSRDGSPLPVTFLRRALIEPPQSREQRVRVLSALGTAELLRDDASSAVGHLSRALADQPVGEARARCALRLAHALVVTARTDEALRLLEREVAGCGLPRTHPLVRRMVADQVFVAFEDHSTPEELSRRINQLTGPGAAGRAIDPWTDTPAGPGSPAGPDSPTRPGSATGPGSTTKPDSPAEPGNPTEPGNAAEPGIAAGPDGEDRVMAAARAFVDALECRTSRRSFTDLQAVLPDRARPSGDGYLGLMMTGAVLLWGDEFATANRFFEEMGADSQQRGAPLCESLALWMQAMVANRTGKLRDAQAHASRASRLIAGQQWDHWLLPPLLSTVEIAGEGGAAGTTFERLAEHGLGGEIPRRWSGDLLLAARGRLRLADGDTTRGLSDLIEAGRRLISIGCLNPAVVAWRSTAALGYARIGQLDDAVPLVEEEVELATRWGAPRALAIALWRRGLVRGGAAGVADAEQAIALADPRELPLVRARALLALGRLQRRASHLPDARSVLTEAYELATTCTATGLADRICAELLAAGGRPRIRSHLQARRLTACESRVATLAARGWTNEAIARELYLARRTVEAHLTSIYRKLDIRGRSQLPTAMRHSESA